MNAKKKLLGKYFDFVKRARVMNSGWYRKIIYVYQKKDRSSPTDNVLP